MSKSFRKDLTGQWFGRLTVLGFVPTEDKYSHWLCRCDCGNIIIIRGTNLTFGSTQSCGCLKKEVEFQITHGGKKTRLYDTWSNMKQRCYNSKYKRYKDYGGRGIRMCSSWRDDFQSFATWAQNNGYKDDLSIDRINNDGNYEPSNCRWVTMAEQQKNKRQNIFVKYNGKMMTLSDAAKKSGINYNTLFSRYQCGYQDERLFRMIDESKSHKK